jgi:hypothetical protein
LVSSLLNSHRADPINGSSMTISKEELAEIARSGYPETADEDPRRAAEAVGLFISDTIAVSTAPGDFRSNDQLRRNATALPPHVTMSHTRYTVTPRSENRAGPEAVPGAVRPERGLAPSGHCVLQLQEHRLRESSVLVPSA